MIGATGSTVREDREAGSRRALRDALELTRASRRKRAPALLKKKSRPAAHRGTVKRLEAPKIREDVQDEPRP